MKIQVLNDMSVEQVSPHERMFHHNVRGLAPAADHASCDLQVPFVLINGHCYWLVAGLCTMEFKCHTTETTWTDHHVMSYVTVFGEEFVATACADALSSNHSYAGLSTLWCKTQQRSSDTDFVCTLEQVVVLKVAFFGNSLEKNL